MRKSSICSGASIVVVPLLAVCCGAPQNPVEIPPAANSATSLPTSSSSASAVPAEPALAAATPAAANETAAAEHKEKHWGYSGDEGPSNWGDLKPEYGACKSGTKQAPIDLPATAPKNKEVKAVVTSYKKPIPVKIINNGHTVQVNNSVDASIMVGSEKFDLVQMHVHNPSEHTINKKSFDVELHLVHKNAKGEFAVIGVLFNKGKENKQLGPFFANLPSSVTHEDSLVTGATVDIGALVPAKGAYYTYSGSLTTPPCTEAVTWLVLEKPAEVGASQVEKLQSVLHGANNRPVQALNARSVSEVKP